VDAYLEIGAKRVFAGAIDWPGWARSGRDEDAALERLLAYAPRYRRAVGRARLGFAGPGDLRVIERLEGDATTDFGAPSKAPAADSGPFGDAELRRSRALLRACWRTFDEAVEAAAGATLRTGPRGGGRLLEEIVAHVAGAEAAYLRSVAARARSEDPHEVREAVLAALEIAARDGLPERGPRGGRIWTARYFVRRAAWHVLDHAWEIEDRSGARPGT